MFDAIRPILRDAHSIYIATHVSPDGDAIGSALGLAAGLATMGKKCTVACIDPAPPALRFMPGSDTLVARPPTTEDLIIVLDTGDLGRLGDLYVAEAFGGRPLIDIDHHVTNSRFGTINIIDAKAASVGEMMFDLLHALGVALDRDMAINILTAMVTDTLGFRTTSTTPRTLTTAATLMQAGAPLSEIVQLSFENRPLPVVRVWGAVLSTFSVRDGIAWASVPRRILERYGVKEDEVKGLVNMLRSTEGVLVSALLMEAPDGKVKVEFRSTGAVDVSSIATALGGGGHRAASGCTLAGPLEAAEKRVLAEVRRQIGGQHGRHSQPVEATRADIS